MVPILIAESGMTLKEDFFFFNRRFVIAIYVKYSSNKKEIDGCVCYCCYWTYYCLGVLSGKVYKEYRGPRKGGELVPKKCVEEASNQGRGEV